jgi:hypothetical protein
MISCDACQKVYSTPYNLKKHLQRQPLCEKWLSLQPGLKDFINEKIKLQAENTAKEVNTTCHACKTVFANLGNLNRHLSTSVICSKWDLYNDLEPVQGYIGKTYSGFDAPEYQLTHIIWNVFLIDKEFAKNTDITSIAKENNIKYIIAILPGDAEHTWLKELKIDYHISTYEGHDTNIDYQEFDTQCKKIEEFREKRENVFVLCNNGYQRSIPFLTYYLYKHHKEEVPTIERAIDIILPQVDKDNYRLQRDNYIQSMKELLN